MRIFGNLFRLFVVAITIVLFYLVDKTEGNIVLYNIVLNTFSLSIFIPLDNFKENKYITFKEQSLYIPNWVVLLLPLLMGLFYKIENTFSILETVVLVVALLILATVIVKLSLYLLKFKRYYYVYICIMGILLQNYIAFFSDTFFKNISFILALSVAGAGFLYEEKRKEQSV